MIYNTDKTAYVGDSGLSLKVHWHLVPREIKDNRSPLVKFFRPMPFVDGPVLCYDVIITPRWVHGITPEYRELLLDAVDNGVYSRVLGMVKQDIEKQDEIDMIRKNREKKTKAEELYNKHMGLRRSGE